MNKKLKLLLGLLAVTTVMGVAAACDNNDNKNNGGGSSISQTATYTVKFVNHDGTVLSEAEYEEGATVTAPTETPTKPDANGYSYTFAGWDKEIAAVSENVTYTATFTATPITYTITFKDGDTEVETVSFTVENGEEKQAPAVPAKDYYESRWGAYDFTKLENQVVEAIHTPITYYVTFLAEDGVTELKKVPFSVEDYEGKESEVPAVPYKKGLTGSWKGYNFETFENQSITVTYVGVNFDDLTEVPTSSIWGDSGRVETATLVEMDGGKVFAAKIMDGVDKDSGLYWSTAFLATLFEDENMDYVAFDIKASANAGSNSVNYRDADGTTWTKYENNGSWDRIYSDTFKTLYFPRSAYEGWVSRGATNDRFLLFGTGVFAGGTTIYIDNIRPVTAEERTADVYSFETGSWRPGATGYFYTPLLGDWELAFSNLADNGVDSGFTQDIVSDGERALSITKNAGDMNITVKADTTVRNAGYAAMDIYAPANSDGAILNFNGYKSSPLKPGAWTTVYLKVTSKSEITKLTDTTGGTYVFDNLRIITEEEYYAKAFSFESGTSVLRDSLNDSNNNAAYVYFTEDTPANKVTLALTKGNGEGDANVISNVRFDSTITHGGNHSLAFDKGSGYMSMSLNNTNSLVFEKLSGGFTFWIYSTVDIDGTTAAFYNGFNLNFNGGDGLQIKANEWTQITVTADDMNGSARFLILQGNWEGTIYLDDFQPLPATDAE